VIDDSDVKTLRGTVRCFWDSSDGERHVLVNIDPDEPRVPDSWDLWDEHHDAVIDSIEEGSRIEIRYRVHHHEIVDPDSVETIESQRAEIAAVRLLD
jgi:hypothetical protein